MSRTYKDTKQFKQKFPMTRKWLRHIVHSDWYEWSVLGKQLGRKEQLDKDLKQGLQEYKEEHQ